MFSSIRQKLLVILGSLYVISMIAVLSLQAMELSHTATFSLLTTLFVLFMIVIYQIVTSIIKPLHKAAQVMENIAFGDGKMSERLPVQGNDELAKLSKAYNQLMEEISHRIVDISISLSTLTGTQAQS